MSKERIMLFYVKEEISTKYSVFLKSSGVEIYGEYNFTQYLQQFLFLVPGYLTNEITFMYCIFIVFYVKY